VGIRNDTVSSAVDEVSMMLIPHPSSCESSRSSAPSLPRSEACHHCPPGPCPCGSVSDRSCQTSLAWQTTNSRLMTTWYQAVPPQDTVTHTISSHWRTLTLPHALSSYSDVTSDRPSYTRLLQFYVYQWTVLITHIITFASAFVKASVSHSHNQQWQLTLSKASNVITQYWTAITTEHAR